MRIGITGASGFIGGHVAEVAVERGHTVVFFDRAGRLVEPLDRLMGEGLASVFLGDVRDDTAMKELAAHVDGIIHLAAVLGTQETIQDPMPSAETNILGGVNFLEACAHHGVPGAYIGVGNHWMNNTYSITKTAVERFVYMFNKERGTRVNIVRLVNAYGERQSIAPPFGPAKVRKITPAFVCRALTGQPLEIYGDGEQVSDMVYVRDGARALVIALENAADGNVWPEPVEVGPALSRTVNEVARTIINAARTLGYSPVEDLVHLPMRPGEIPGARVTADVSTLAMAGMHWSDLTGLDEGIFTTVRWYAENWLPDYLEAQQGGPAVVGFIQGMAAAEKTPFKPDYQLSDTDAAMLRGHVADQAHGQDHGYHDAVAADPEAWTTGAVEAELDAAQEPGIPGHECGAECNPSTCAKLDF
jgi:UDP-glucose 4-epimerase